MKREDRYFVIKKSDLEAALKVKRITQTDVEDLKELLARMNTQRFVSNKEMLKCVVVEHDWPEYERVWDMIEARVNMENQRKELSFPPSVRVLATKIAEACIQDEHDEGYDLTAGLFGPHLSELITEMDGWRKKAEAYDKIQYCEGCGQTRGTHHRECQHPSSLKGE